MNKEAQRGDTIIEVVLAFAIFAMAAVSTVALINKGLATTQRNLETTLVRQQIDSQAELLRHLRTVNNSAWQSIVSSGNIVSSPRALANSCDTVQAGDHAFYVRPNVNATNPEDTTYTREAAPGAAYVASPTTYAKINYSDGANRSEGVWVQATLAQQNGSVKAYDFYIHACWDSVGVNTPMTLGTIVRIYE